MKYKEKIFSHLKKNGPNSIDFLTNVFGVSRQYIHRLLNELMDEGLVKKVGTAPHVFYSIVEEEKSSQPAEGSFETPLSYDKEKFLNENFIIVTALGEKLEGVEAMKYWCQNQNLPFTKTVDEYIKTRKKYLGYYNENYLIDGLKKLQNTKGIGTLGVDYLFYLDFYAIERFGKTRLGTLMHYAKQGQNRMLMAEIVKETRNRIMHLIQIHQIESILYVPPTIKRQIQIMDYLEKNLKLNLPKIRIKKIANQIIIPQKALSKLFERVANAKNTFIVPEQEPFQKILILDDAIGSGATINEIAKKVKEKNIAKEIVGLAITGSFKDFDVISEL